MSLTDIDVQLSYKSRGETNIINAFLLPALKKAVSYKRSVGFFSSSVFELYNDSLETFILNGGKIKIICSPELSCVDVDSIKKGYSLRETYSMMIEDDIYNTIINVESEFLTVLASLISNNVLDIKVVDVLDDDFEKAEQGIYHDKIGIVADSDGNKVLFVGSANESKTAYSGSGNYEKIRAYATWKNEENRVADDEEEFDDIWEGKNPYIRHKSVNELVSKHVENEIKKRGIVDGNMQKKSSGVKLRDYQEKAIASWLANDYKGFFVMATGTGKTWTAIYAALEVLKKGPLFLVICAPYKHLVRQWYEDVHKVLPEAKTVLVSSENPKWENELKNALLYSKFNKASTVIAISTIISFNMAKFTKIAEKSSMPKMLIVDEAHRFTNRNEKLKETYIYMLGLSATPSSKKNDQKGEDLMNFFGGRVFNLPLEFAIKRKYLVKYNYHPIFVNATIEEEQLFDKYSKLMATTFVNGQCIDVEALARYKRSRLRVIAMANEKIVGLKKFISQINEENHFIVYCGDGKMFDGKSSEEKKHINYVKETLSELGYKVSQFTATETMEERMNLVEMFNRGMIDSLAAIRCLDEGINIPSIKSALILASNDDYREFVQRRGRILRTYCDEYSGIEKTMASIYDIIVLPSVEMKTFATIEFRRFYEYASLADNKDECMSIFDNYIAEYGIDFDEIIDIQECEDEMDE